MSMINSVIIQRECAVFNFLSFFLPSCVYRFLGHFSFSSKKGKGKKFKWIKFGTNVDLSDERK